MKHNGTQRITLVLAAHGAADDPRCAAPVHRHAETIRAMGLYAEVITIFWKEQPYFRELHDQTDASDVLIVPVMTASGYYSNTVLPREIGEVHPPSQSGGRGMGGANDESGELTHPLAPSLKGGGTQHRNIRIAQPIGELPAMTDIIIEQTVSVATECGIDPGEAHCLLIGHGTRRDPVRSGATTLRHAASVKSRNIFSGVSAGFLEQDPEVTDAFTQIEGDEPVIIVPLLIANGGHASDDIPSALGVKPGARIASVSKRPVLFADAVGEHPRMVNLILQSAEQVRMAEAKVA